MFSDHYGIPLLENRLRIAEANRRASPLAALGPMPDAQSMRPFRRCTIPLMDVVEIQHAPAVRAVQAEAPSPSLPAKAA
jgi:hypothetical protein